ncbi:HYC_CC_PP family protein [Pedobacter frigoris]|uniref:Uncharacterized protein n=1 Tax=Pedobacter frigoris TaxID=2571272 RepID=A0A4U1CI49_9SPHI|nr:hypothetical protein [Pedobacter frigoris]TKC04965.1 hypothetical protein FA047_14440 [Pedobacter frigoris]
MKLQQKIAMCLCAFYLITAIGIGLNMHFCSGKLSSVRLAKPAKCGACKGEEKASKAHDCCKDSSIDVKVKDSHEAGFKVKLPQDFSLELFLGHLIRKSFSAVVSHIYHKVENKAPPLSAVLSLHIYNCIFRN